MHLEIDFYTIIFKILSVRCRDLNKTMESLLVSDLLYRQTVTVNNTPLEVEIVDVSGETVSKINHPI